MEVTKKMKKQTGVSIDTQVWNAYRSLCRRESLWPSEPITEFLELVLRNGSPLVVVNMMRGMVKERSEGFEAYVRVLLNWYKNGRTWIHVTDASEAYVEPMLLHALKDLADPQLREDIQETLRISSCRQANQTVEKKKPTKRSSTEPIKASISERISQIRKQVEGHGVDAERAQEMLKKIQQIREELETERKSRTKKH
jgi:heterodisulfide reductase subunit C